jgi:hypothetical protein
MGKPDTLSRWADHRSRQGDNDNLTLPAPELFWIHALAGVRLEGDEHNIFSERFSVVSKTTCKRNQWQRQLASFGRTRAGGTIKSAEWSESDRLLMFHSKIYVPNDRDLRCHIVEQHHDMCIAGHAGHFKTLELISHNYWWPQMSHYIGIYVKHCDLCN